MKANAIEELRRERTQKLNEMVDKIKELQTDNRLSDDYRYAEVQKIREQMDELKLSILKL